MTNIENGDKAISRKVGETEAGTNLNVRFSAPARASWMGRRSRPRLLASSWTGVMFSASDR